MTKVEIINDLKHLIDLCNEGVSHDVLYTNFNDKEEVQYLYGYSNAIKTHITNLSVLIDKIEMD